MPHLSHQKGAPSADSMVIQSLRCHNRLYELRYNRCGKKTCWCTRTAHHPTFIGPPGHGPYWYLIISSNHRCRRLYVGKELDTSKHIGHEGQILWPTKKTKPTKKENENVQ